MANAGNYATLPTSTSTGAVNSTGIVNFDWDITNSTTDAKSHGFILPSTKVDDTHWYFEEEEVAFINPNGDTENTSVIQVASLTNLAVGMELIFYKGTTAPELKNGSSAGSIRITEINQDEKTITFNNEVGFDQGQTMTFRAYGSTAIDAAIGLGVSFGAIKVKGQSLTTTVRANVSSSTTVTLDATLGISGGNIVKYTGVGVNNSSANAITSVTPDPDGSDDDGAMVVQLAQTLQAGTLLTFTGSHKTIDVKGIINISKYPAASASIYLDLEKLIKLGISGS